VVFQEPALDGKLTGRENLEFHTMMYGIGKAERRRRIDEVLALVELEDKAATLVEKYSGGMKRRLEIAEALRVAFHLSGVGSLYAASFGLKDVLC
jgi:ABC-2 type transport system ATP-binding protein